MKGDSCPLMKQILLYIKQTAQSPSNESKKIFRKFSELQKIFFTIYVNPRCFLFNDTSLIIG